MFILDLITGSIIPTTAIGAALPRLRTASFQAIQQELMSQTPNEELINRNLIFLRATRRIAFAPPANTRDYFQNIIVNGMLNIGTLQGRVNRQPELAGEIAPIIGRIQRQVQYAQEFQPARTP
jgi:hypothetical protein